MDDRRVPEDGSNGIVVVRRLAWCIIHARREVQVTRRMGSKLVLSVLVQQLPARSLSHGGLQVLWAGSTWRVLVFGTGVGYRIAVSFRSTPTGLQGRKLGHAHRHFRLQASTLVTFSTFSVISWRG